MLSLVEGKTDIKENEKEIHITELFRWFLGDFGGKKGIIKILSNALQPDVSDYMLVYIPYLWEDALDYFY